MVVRPVHADVGEVRSDPQYAREAGPAHDAVRRVVHRQQREHVLVMPARVPELHCEPDPLRDQAQEIGQPGVIARLGRRQLDQQHGALVPQFVPAVADAG